MSRDLSAFLPLSPDVLMILLAVRDRSLHGYAIIKDAEDRSDGAVRIQTGALYRALKRLLADDLIDEDDPPADEAGQDERRRYYAITTLGGAVVKAELDRMAAIVRAAGGKRAGAKRPRFA